MFTFRKALLEDESEIARLIDLSVRGLSAGDYDAAEIDLSLKTVFGVDRELIADETYYVAVAETGEIAGCGGWSKRRTLYGASVYGATRDSEFLDPARDAAKIRAFFIHPNYARRGIGSKILDLCERAAREHGFRAAEMAATLPGVRLYEARGYAGDERITVPVGENKSIICIKMRKNLL